MAEQRLLMAVVQYDGTDYYGFQVQRQRPTIQGALEEALYRVTKQPVRVTAAGRTDSGVHARAQVISFRAGWARSLGELQQACNARLPTGITVHAVRDAPDEFHARRSAVARSYRYTINNSQVRAPLRDRYAWHVAGRLKETAMHRALQTYTGTHDFIAFGRAPRPGGSTVRTINSARCWREIDRVVIDLTADAFLQGMVLRIVGALVAVGKGQLTTDEFEGLLKRRDKSLVKWKAAPQGLCLWEVEY